MKKRTLLLFAVGLLGLTSCGGSGAKVETLDKIGTSVLTADFVRVNVEANQVKKNTAVARPQLISQKITDNSGYSFVDFDSSYGGLIVTQNQAGYFGIYSTYLGQYIIEPCVNQFKMYELVCERDGIRSLFEKCYKDNLHSIWAQLELYKAGTRRTPCRS